MSSKNTLWGVFYPRLRQWLYTCSWVKNVMSLAESGLPGIKLFICIDFNRGGRCGIICQNIIEKNKRHSFECGDLPKTSSCPVLSASCVWGAAWPRAWMICRLHQVIYLGSPQRGQQQPIRPVSGRLMTRVKVHQCHSRLVLPQLHDGYTWVWHLVWWDVGDKESPSDPKKRQHLFLIARCSAVYLMHPGNLVFSFCSDLSDRPSGFSGPFRLMGPQRNAKIHAKNPLKAAHNRGKTSPQGQLPDWYVVQFILRPGQNCWVHIFFLSHNSLAEKFLKFGRSTNWFGVFHPIYQNPRLSVWLFLLINKGRGSDWLGRGGGPA